MKNYFKKFFVLLSIPLAVCGLYGCDEELPEGDDDGVVHVESVSLNAGSTLDLMRTKTYQLEVSILPTNAENQEFRWINTNPVVASISEDGEIKALKEGQTIIGVQTADKNKRGLTTVNVTKYVAEVPITAITLSETDYTFADISSPALQLVMSYEPANPTLADFTWTSSNNACVQVDVNGLVTIIGGGEATVRVTSNDGGDAFCECKVKVPGTAVKDKFYDYKGPNYDDGYYKKVYEPIQITVPVLDANRNYVGTTTQIWLDRNLGAERRAENSTDCKAFGSYFQFGRKADGHEKVIWTATTNEDGTITNVGTPVVGDKKAEAVPSRADAGTSSWITVNDWTEDQSFLGWGGTMISISDANYSKQYDSYITHSELDDVNQQNNPCPYGYRVPSIMELHQLVMSAAGVTNMVFNANNTFAGLADALYKAPYYLPLAGSRAYNTGNFGNQGSYIMIWSNSAATAANASHMRVQKTNVTRLYPIQRGTGYPIRCIKD